MSETPKQQTCGKCGAALSGYAPDGLCAACLMESAFEEPDAGTGEKLKPGPLLAFNDYELLEEIARGGMGVVYRARQISLNRIVAIKMILGGHLANAAEMQRFRAEAETAAHLQHPNIVAIHEVGEHASQPFFTMDLVKGRNLAQLVRDEPLPSRTAASYLKTIAEAVQYAHSHGVLHRDLKPSNILIDDSDQSRITDFGLAKRLTSDSGLETSDLTQTGQVLGSPSFIPPEQAAGQKDVIGPASDVYSLGAILYHCLTARPPFVAETMTQTLRMVAENDPISPRLLNASVPRDLETICLKCLQKDTKRRYATAQDLADELGRFLREEPIHARPATPVEKAWRWSQRKPAMASAILLLLVVAVGSPIAAFRINRERQQAEANGKRAQMEAAKSQQVSKALKEMLLAAGPSVARGRDATVLREILEKTSERVEKEINDQPEVQGDLFYIIGNTYEDMGDHPRAATNYQRAVATYHLAFSGAHTNLALALAHLGRSQSFTGDLGNGHSNAALGLQMARQCGDTKVLIQCLVNYARTFKPWGMGSPEEEPYIREALELGKKQDSDPVQVAARMMNLASISTNDIETEKLLKDAIALYRQHLPPDHRSLVDALFGLGQHLLSTGQFAEAEKALREARQGFQKIHDPDQPYQPIVLRFFVESLLVLGKGDEAESLVRQQVTATPANGSYQDLLGRVIAFRRGWGVDDEILNYLKGELTGDFLLWDLADKLAKAGKLADVEQLYREGLRKQRELAGPENLNLAWRMHHLADLCVKQDKLAEAEILYREALANEKKLLGNEHLDVAKSLHDLAYFLQSENKLAAAEELYREELAIRRKLQGDDNLDTVEALRCVAWMLRRQGNLPAAESAIREALANGRKLLGNENLDAAKSLHDLANILQAEDKLADAEEIYREELAIRRKLQGDDHLDVAEALRAVAWMLQRQGKLPEGESFVREALAIRKKQLGSKDQGVAEVLGNLADFVKSQGRHSEAETLYRETLALRGDRPESIEMMERLAEVLRDQGKVAEAEAKYHEALTLIKKVPAPEDRGVPVALNTLANMLAKQGRLPEAENLHREAAEVARKLPLDKDHDEFLEWSLGYLGQVLQQQDKLDEAEACFREALAISRSFSTDTRHKAEINLAGLIDVLERKSNFLMQQGKLDKAEALYREALELRRRFNGRENSGSVWPVYHLATFLRDQGKVAEAEAKYLEALALMKKVLGPEDRGVPVTLNTLANMLAKQGRLPEAESLHREAAEVARKMPPSKDRDELLQWSLRDLGNVSAQQGKLDEAETSYLDRAEFFARRGQWKEAAASLRKSVESDPDDSVSYSFLAAILLARGEVEDYRQISQKMLSRFGGTTNAAVADRIAKACLIYPASGADSSVAAELADTAVTQGQSHTLLPWFELCKSLAEYRQEHFVEAVDWAQKAVANAEKVLERDACAYLMLAMAQMKLKQESAARTTLGKASEIVDGKIPKLDGDDLGALWVDVIIANILMREARALIEGKATPGAAASKTDP